MYTDGENDETTSEDLFKPAFKKFKSRKNDIDLEEVIDFHSIEIEVHHKCDEQTTPTEHQNSSQVNETQDYCDSAYIRRIHASVSTEPGNSKGDEFGLMPCANWKIYQHDLIPGLLCIVDPFRDSKSKHYWIKQCLINYHQCPNICNLDAHRERKTDLWTDFVESMNKGGRINRTEFFKLRWVTLGYQYDWNTKLYYQERFSDFPSDLAKLSKYLAECLGYSYYRAEAGIVNYYHLDSTLAGHTDHSEYDMDSPLFSISFGCDAIFLIGGKTKATKPVPIYLRSGDIVVMAGESRLAYHAVPKIIPPKSQQEDKYDEDISDPDNPDSHGKWIKEYMKVSRININIRQVLKENQEFPG